MKIIFERKSFLQAINTLSRAVANKSTIPALEGIMMLCENGNVKMIAYNMEIGMTTIVPANIMSEGEVIINASDLCSFVRSLTGDEVTIEVDERYSCIIESGSTRYEVSGRPTEEFPEFPSLSDGKKVEISSEMLKSMVRQTIFAISTRIEEKPIQTGILFDVTDGILNLVALDGNRLALREEQVGNMENVRFITAGLALGEVVKMLGEEETQIVINIGDRHVSFEIGDYTLISRLLDGEFIDYKNILPKTFKTKMKVSTSGFMSAVERTSLVIIDRMRNPLRFNLKDTYMEMSCVSAKGRSDDVCDIEVTGELIEIGFNSKYVIDALRACESDEVFVNFNGPSAPMVFKPLEGEGFTFMIMPVRIRAAE